jgi:lipopolysaccharide/colanic/teichoic acid biosynthesis glycosyltransferase/glycosyltransferase involved in cell wall biosynthesis
MKEERFDIVHVHTPVAAVLGRVAAWAAGVPIVLYTAHGFYFHEHMHKRVRRLVVWLEKLLCRITDLIFTQSYEDALTAVREAICPEEKVLWIGNGVDIRRFATEPSSNGARESLGFSAQDKVVGFVGRLVREKGILELIQAMRLVVEGFPDAKLLLVGDTLDSDRDRTAKLALRREIGQDGLAHRIVFTGHVEDVASMIAAVDLFVLPSHREGMPRTIIEAMASGKPVVATNIRGCREEVVHGLTGLLVPVKDPAALATAIISLLSNPELTQKMGAESRRRAFELFDEQAVLNKQIKAYGEIIHRKLGKKTRLNRRTKIKQIRLWLKRAMDFMISSISLPIISLPLLIIAILIKLDSPGPIFFRQERVGEGGKPFSILKFRTLLENSGTRGDTPFRQTKDDPCITKIGKIIRAWGLDELPQLFNVLRGELSIVGPRAGLRYQVENYNDFQWQRLLVKPGITGLAVISGRNLLSWRERIRLDVWYIRHWSLWLDIKIILKTFWVVLVTREGVYGPKGINDDFISSVRSPELR